MASLNCGEVERVLNFSSFSTSRKQSWVIHSHELMWKIGIAIKLKTIFILLLTLDMNKKLKTLDFSLKKSLSEGVLGIAEDKHHIFRIAVMARKWVRAPWDMSSSASYFFLQFSLNWFKVVHSMVNSVACDQRKRQSEKFSTISYGWSLRRRPLLRHLNLLSTLETLLSIIFRFIDCLKPRNERFLTNSAGKSIIRRPNLRCPARYALQRLA